MVTAATGKNRSEFGDHEFLMCNDWYAEQRGAFDAWVRDIERGNLGGANAASPPDNRSEAGSANSWR